MYETVVLSLQHFNSIQNLAFLLMGTLIGLVFGTVPGLGGATTLALVMPLTYGMDTTSAMILAGGLMGSVAMGGSITAVLINTPGSAPSAATCLDGYPMTQQGRAGVAIGALASSTSLGALIGVFSLLAVLPVARKLVMAFGPPEFFLLAVLGMTAISISAGGKLVRGMMVGTGGVVLSFIGYDAVNGGQRFTFGSEYLSEGIPLVPAMLGLFAVSEMIDLAVRGGAVAKLGSKTEFAGIWEGVCASFKHWPVVLRSSLIGTIEGSIPGVGGTAASFLAYSVTVQADNHPETFGTGRVEGVIAPEAAINAKEAACLIPTLTFGIPAGIEMAVFLGMLILHGIEPGPMLLLNHSDTIYALVIALTLSCLIGAIVGMVCIKPLALITRIDVHILVPLILAVSAAGTYSIHQQPYDVLVTAAFGVFGYLLRRFEYPRLPLVLALVLGPVAERSFQQTMMITDGSWRIFFDHTVSEVLMGVIALAIVLPLWRGVQHRRLATKGGAA
ncbi:MAG: tricarboxylic transporter [Xanthobacteraceae bacterium]|nr:MAG: tricarboxylic transporter [Xanthobacteraceae bacterium]